MVWNRIRITGVISLVVVMLLATSCSISYKFNGSSIDYTKTQTVAFEYFQNRSTGFVWGPMESIFNTALQDIFVQQTRLKQVNRGGDLEFSGEITNYDAINKGIGADGFSNMVELRMSVKVRFVNNINHTEDFDQTFTSRREYDSRNQQLNAVQDELVAQMCKDLAEQIFNASVANW
ncbi:MAG: LPS assembly lipoprotein LptE [Phocaeicola sp.]